MKKKNGVFYDVYGTKRWYKDGELHREDGPAVIRYDGVEIWYINGLPHREDGPAEIHANGSQVWYRNGKKHRVDGPADIFSDISADYYLYDKFYSKEEWWQQLNAEEKVKALFNGEGI